MNLSVKRMIVRTAILFVCLIAFYFIAMSAVYLIPNENIKDNFHEGADTIYEEGEYSEPFFEKPQARFDGTTDIIMMMECYQKNGDGLSPFESAMDINGYSRFWHGYQIFLRPALTFMRYANIRYVNAIMFFIVFCLSFSAVKKHISTISAILYVIVMIMAYSFLAPMNMQYMASYMVAMSAVVVMLFLKEKFQLIYLLFFAVGSIINFFDFLTFPILTLCLPLAMLFFAREKTMERTLFKKIADIFISAVMWGLGYALTWISKWTIGSIITGNNIFEDVLREAGYRMTGNEHFPVKKVVTFGANILQFATLGNAVISAIIIAIIAALLIIGHKKLKKTLAAWPVFIIASFPYFWYLVLSNHSQYHYFFTYRAQIASVFIVFAFMAHGIDTQKVKSKLYNFYNKLRKVRKAE